MYYARFETRLCEIILVGDERGLANLHMNTGKGNRVFQVAKEWRSEPAFFVEVQAQVEEYVNGEREAFNVTLNPSGTPFQKCVWNELRRIPYGQTRTYGQVAAAIGRDKAARAVGMANNKNPIPLIIPCHRVIGANGSLTGFAHGLALKEQLLALEKYTFVR